MIGPLLAWAFVVGMLGLGVAACLAPGPTSALYGVAQEGDGFAWVRAAGVRDLGLCAIIAPFLLRDDPESAAIALLATAGIAVCDFANVVATRGVQPLPLAVHASGIAVGAVSAGLLLAGI